MSKPSYFNFMDFPVPHPLIAGLTSIVVIVASISLGYYLGRSIAQRGIDKSSAPISSVVAAVLGLLAFTLAFTFNIAATRFDARKKLVLEEANAIGTLSLRSQLLSSELASKMKPLIKEYVNLRIEGAENEQLLANAISRSEELQSEMWKIAKSIAIESPQSQITHLFINALNSVIDLQESRVTVRLYYRIPPIAWILLTFVTVASMLGVGVQFGTANHFSWVATIILAFAFSAVVVLVADLDNPSSGFLRTNQRPIMDLLRSISSASQS